MRMHCPSCGAEVDDADQFCYRCGAELRPGVVIEAKPPPPGYVPPTPYAPVPPAAPHPPSRPLVPSPRLIEYGGFWRRFGAYIIDSLIVVFLQLALSAALGILPWAWNWIVTGGGLPWYWLSPFVWLEWLLLLAVDWLYFAGFECSSMQATPGKMALGLVVTDLTERRITFLRATARYLSKIVSVLTLYIGFVMIGFTAKKQGLHDMMAGTLVFHKGV
jgi:uncharacterized RDD family membrane protein YckC